MLTGPDITGPASGFATGTDKHAFLAGNFVLRTTLPTGPVSVPGQRLSTAAEAFAVLRGTGNAEQDASTPLAVIAVRRGTGTFATDRGTRTLPAWSFRFAGVTEPALLLAIPAAERWPRPGMPSAIAAR